MMWQILHFYDGGVVAENLFFPPRLLPLVNLENKERQLLKSGATGSVQAPQQLNKFSDFYASPRHTVSVQAGGKSKKNSLDFLQ